MSPLSLSEVLKAVLWCPLAREKKKGEKKPPGNTVIGDAIIATAHSFRNFCCIFKCMHPQKHILYIVKNIKLTI